MRIFNVICVGSVLFLIISSVIGDYQKRKKDPIPATRVVSEVVQFSRDPFTGKSASSANDARFWPIIRVRRKRQSGAVNGEAAKGREGKRKKKRERERGQRRQREKDGERDPVKYRDGKKERKREPLTRHARRPQRRRSRRPHKEAGTNRTRSPQRSHERRNLEKQYLVRNRTLELLEKKTTEEAANRSSFIYPVNNVRNVIFERRITPEKIGQILGDGRGAPSLRIADLLIPKTFLETGSKKSGLEMKANDLTGQIHTSRNFESNYNTTHNKNVQRINEKCISETRRLTEADNEPPLFLGKLKSIAMNVSRINKVTEKLRKDSSDVEISPRPTDLEESSYGYEYENVFEDPSVSPWVNPPRSKEAVHTERENQEYFLDTALLSSIYMPIDDRITLQQGLATLLARLFQTLRNTTDEENRELLQDLDFDNSAQGDLCQKWLDCKDKLEEAFLGPLVLPACPCHYPSSIFYDDKIWDEGQQRHFRWRDVSGESERLDVYKPGATYCIRSLLAQGEGSAAAQHCCYDGRRRLLTRGSGAGTPNFVSPEVSAVLHERIDVLPWRLCKGDFSRFNKVRPPNNDNRCKSNPDEDEYQRQIDTTKHY